MEGVPRSWKERGEDDGWLERRLERLFPEERRREIDRLRQELDRIERRLGDEGR